MLNGLVSTCIPGSRWAVTNYGILRIAGNEQHLEIRPQDASRIGHLAAVHAAREPDIGDEKIHASVCFAAP